MSQRVNSSAPWNSLRILGEPRALKTHAEGPLRLAGTSLATAVALRQRRTGEVAIHRGTLAQISLATMAYALQANEASPRLVDIHYAARPHLSHAPEIGYGPQAQIGMPGPGGTGLMSLDEYRKKRDFEQTPEPRGKGSAPARGKLSYVIQKHDASHLHYDFRLEHQGVLKSWAVPKGPDLDPAVKRLAMQVEDHPLDYGDFEGTIPEGEYGGGTVMLWDKGEWEPQGDAAKGFREGSLKFILHGEKLKGAWMLVRKGGRKAEAGERAWFLFKERDAFARPGESITEEMPLSVATGRDLDEIAAESDRVWGPHGELPPHNRQARGKTATAATATRRNRAARCRRGRREGQRARLREGDCQGGASRKTGRKQFRAAKAARAPRRSARSVAAEAGRRAGHARRRGAGRRRLAARDQVRRLPDVMPP